MSSGRRPGRPRGPQQDPAERRAALLTAAEVAIRAHGPDVSMEQIASQASVSKATLYDNFDGKGGLTEALIERYGVRLLREFGAALVQPLTPRQVVSEGIGIFVRYIDADPQLYRFIVRHADGELLLQEITAPISALIRSVDAAAPEVLAHAVMGTIVTSTGWWSRHRTPDAGAFVELLTGFVWAGLEASGVRDEGGPVDVGALAEAIAAVRPGEPRT
jgi:AcrR family transcriptional regulator